MDAWEQEFYITQIMSGVQYVELSSRTFILERCSPRDKHISNVLYKKYLNESKQAGVYTEEQLLDYMYERGLWSRREDLRLDKLKQEIEDGLVSLYQNRLQSNTQALIRNKLDALRSENETLLEKRHEYDYLTADQVALSAKIRYIVGSSLYTEGGRKVWKNRLNWSRPDTLLDRVIQQLNLQTLPAKTYRHLARSDYWGQIWSCRKSCASLFGCTASELTDQQKQLVFWSVSFENIAQHPEPPDDESLSDDDLLDGWFIIQRRKREFESNKKLCDSKLSNPKIAGASEVFIMAESESDVKKIWDRNTSDAKSVFKGRMNQLKNQEIVNELEMADTKQEIQMLVNQQAHRKG